MADWVDVSSVDEFKVGTWKVLDVDDVLIAVFNIDGDFFAIEDVCTHDGECLTDGGDLEGDEMICPRHGARFSVKTGEALCAPAYEPVKKFPVRVENNTVQVRDNRWD